MSTVLIEFLIASIGLTALAAAYSGVATRSTLGREGITCFNGFRTKVVPWPTSRSAVFPTPERRLARIYALAPRWFRREAGRVLQMLQNDSSLRAAAQHAATVWAWAQSRGLVRDDGVYRFAYRVDVEEGRRRAAERLDYLRTKGQ